MKQLVLSTFLASTLLSVTGESLGQEKMTPLTGPYLGQEPPGLTAKVFAPGFVASKNRDYTASFTPDLKELYFTRKDIDANKWWLISFQLQDNNRWKQSIVMRRVGRPTLAPNGNTMHLGSKYMERTKKGWSAVKSLGPMFDREDWGIMRLSASAKGTYVFDDYKNGDILRISEVKNGKRLPPVVMGPEINTGKWTAHPFIAADDSYLIFDTEKADGYGDKDLYISFRKPDGSWTQAVNLGDSINTDGVEAGGYVSPDGKYLFFNRSPNTPQPGVDPEGDIYWVDAQVIEKLRPLK